MENIVVLYGIQSIYGKRLKLATISVGIIDDLVNRESFGTQWSHMSHTPPLSQQHFHISNLLPEVLKSFQSFPGLTSPISH